MHYINDIHEYGLFFKFVINIKDIESNKLLIFNSILFKDNKAITEEGDAFFDNYNNYGKGTVSQDLPVDESGICLDTNYVSDDSGHSENEAAVEPEAKKRKIAWIDEDDAQEL